MEGYYIFNCSICQIFHFTDNIPAVWMSFGKQILQNYIIIKSIRSIIDALSFFILNHVLLICKGSFCNSIFKETHSVGFHPQCHFKGIFWNHFIIVGYCPDLYFR